MTLILTLGHILIAVLVGSAAWHLADDPEPTLTTLIAGAGLMTFGSWVVISVIDSLRSHASGPVIKSVAGTMVVSAFLAAYIAPGVSARILWEASALGPLEIAAVISLSGASLAAWIISSSEEDADWVHAGKIALIAPVIAFLAYVVGSSL